VIALLVPAAFAGKWDGRSADVRAERPLAAPPEAVTELVRDLGTLSVLMPADCATRWELQERTAGVGARARVTYTIASMRRTLTVVVSKDEPGVLLELDHEGRKGFFTHIRPEASTVSMTTFLEPPPWPFRGVFYRKVQPAWVDCHARTLEALVARIPGASSTH
jgi:hypothetical protein